jgi:beta-carotene 3-hydroxylase
MEFNMEYLVNISILLTAFFGMEGVAWLTHKYIMHGLFWNLHRDHHKKDVYGFFEKNDYFFLIFATPGILCLFYGLYYIPYLFWIGLGITSYGFAYFIVHDLFIHQRFKILRRSDWFYFRAIRKAHKVHHKVHTKEGCENFGMLWVSIRYFKEAKRVL